MNIRIVLTSLVLGTWLCHGPGLEAVEHGLGAIVNPTTLPAPSIRALAAAQTTAGYLPAIVDLTPMLPPVGDQGDTGSCVGWAFGYYLRTIQQQEQTYWGTTTTGHQFSPWYIYNQINVGRNVGEDLGSDPLSACSLLCSQGCDLLSEFDPSNVYIQPNTTQIGYAVPWRNPQYAVLPTTPINIKQELFLGNPVVLAIQVYPQFDQLTAANQVYDQVIAGQVSRGSHAICLVGYNDNMPCSDGTVGAFHFVNQWGTTTWGNNGFGWISYSLMTNASVSPIPITAAYTVYPPAGGALVLSATPQSGVNPPYFAISRANGNNMASPVVVSYSVTPTGGYGPPPPVGTFATKFCLYTYGGSDKTPLPAAGTLTIPAGQGWVWVSLYTSSPASFTPIPATGIPPVHPVAVTLTIASSGFTITSPSMTFWFRPTSGIILR